MAKAMEATKGRLLWVAALAMTAALAGSGTARAGDLRLEPRASDGADVVVDLVADGVKDLGSADLTVRFDPTQLETPRLERGALSALGMMVNHAPEPGRLRIAFVAPLGVSGEGALATLRFGVRPRANGSRLSLTGAVTDVDGRALGGSLRGTTIALAGGRDAGRSREPGADAPATVEPAAAAGADGSARPEVPEAGPGRATAARPVSDSIPKEGPSQPERSAGRASTEGSGGSGSESRQATRKPELDFQVESEVRERVAPREADSALRKALAEERGAADSPEEEALRKADLQARLRGYRVLIRFEPERAIADSSRTPLDAHIAFFRHGLPLPVDPSEIDLRAMGCEVGEVRAATDGPGLRVALQVDREALPARLDVRALDLWERRWVPVYPPVDPDVDGSGTLSFVDLLLMRRHVGAEQGTSRYDERFDVVRDGRIDEADYEAFEFILVERERARRLEESRRSREAGGGAE